MAASVLIVDDEPNIVLSLEFLMRQAGYDVRVARDGDAALAAVAERVPDLVLLDVMMPGRDGYEVCQAIRANSACARTRIVMLTARSREVEREKGIALGADDYVTKPFSTRELVSRVKALLRRRLAPEPSVLTWGRLRLDIDEHRVFVDDVEVVLTATELRLLAALLRRPHRALGREELADAAYPDARNVSERTVDSHIRRVRAKLRPFGLDPFETVHGVGFRLGAAS
jgi:two-component system OmpR family response regulator